MGNIFWNVYLMFITTMSELVWRGILFNIPETLGARGVVVIYDLADWMVK